MSLEPLTATAVDIVRRYRFTGILSLSFSLSFSLSQIRCYTMHTVHDCKHQDQLCMALVTQCGSIDRVLCSRSFSMNTLTRLDWKAVRLHNIRVYLSYALINGNFRNHPRHSPHSQRRQQRIRNCPSM